MIVSFANKDARKILKGEKIKHFSKDLQEAARMKLRMLNNSHELADLKTPPFHRFGKMKDKPDGFYSIGINNQCRIIFKWKNGNASDVELLDSY